MIARLAGALGRRVRSFGRNDQGQSLVELAITAPFLLILVGGVFQGGYYMYESIEIGNAARAGAQYGAQNANTEGDSAGMVSAAVADASGIGLTSSDVSASTFCACDSAQGTVVDCGASTPCAANDRLDVFVDVVATKAFVPAVRFPGLPQSITMTRTAIEQVTP